MILFLKLRLCPVLEGLAGLLEGVVAGGAGGFEGVVEEVGLAEEVEFDFGFGAGWSGGDLDADGLCGVGVIDQQVAAGAGDGWERGIGGQCGAEIGRAHV